MQIPPPASPVHIGVRGAALIGTCIVSVLALLIASIRQSRKLHLIHDWGRGQTGNVFQGPAEWADINEAADRLPLSKQPDEER